MPDILTRLRDAYAENPASALALLPELFQAVDEGKIICTQDRAYEIEGFYCTICHKPHWRIAECEIGKTVFLTREAAEKALKERESDAKI